MRRAGRLTPCEVFCVGSSQKSTHARTAGSTITELELRLSVRKQTHPLRRARCALGRTDARGIERSACALEPAQPGNVPSGARIFVDNLQGILGASRFPALRKAGAFVANGGSRWSWWRRTLVGRLSADFSPIGTRREAPPRTTQFADAFKQEPRQGN
jgi:hypothetical protein